jgi:hypothetical protein
VRLRPSEIIEAAGAKFLSIEGNAVVIQDKVTGKKIQVYTSALRSVDDVRMALKAAREKVRDFPPM